jgi:hypothetical protein
MDFCGHALSSARLYGHRHFDFSVEAVQNGHQPVNGEAAQVRVPYPGKIRCGNARQASRLPYGQYPPFIQDVDNRGGQYGAQLLRIGIKGCTLYVRQWSGRDGRAASRASRS